jgi:outer membrane murein-binding lipoprotein Lpp
VAKPGRRRGDDLVRATLAQSAAHLAAAERGIVVKKIGVDCKKDASNHRFCDSIRTMDAGLEALPDDIETLKAALMVARAEAAAARAQRADDQALEVWRRRWRSCYLS